MASSGQKDLDPAFAYLEICVELGRPAQYLGIPRPAPVANGVCGYAKTALDRSYADEQGAYMARVEGARAAADCPPPMSDAYARVYDVSPAQFIELTDLVRETIRTAKGQASANSGLAQVIRQVRGYAEFSEAANRQGAMTIDYVGYERKGPLNLYDIYDVGLGPESFNGNFVLEIRKYLFAKPNIVSFGFAIP